MLQNQTYNLQVDPHVGYKRHKLIRLQKTLNQMYIKKEQSMNVLQWYLIWIVTFKNAYYAAAYTIVLFGIACW